MRQASNLLTAAGNTTLQSIAKFFKFFLLNATVRNVLIIAVEGIITLSVPKLVIGIRRKRTPNGPGRLSIKTRLELETKVLAAALKISLQRGDLQGARLTDEQLSRLMKAAQNPKADTVVAASAKPIPPAQPKSQQVAGLQQEQSASAIDLASGHSLPLGNWQFSSKTDFSSLPSGPPLPLAIERQGLTAKPPQSEVSANLEMTEPVAEDAGTELKPDLPASKKVDSQLPPPPQPTATDALRRSVVNTPLNPPGINTPASGGSNQNAGTSILDEN